jgi:hypothetical protein
MRKHCHHGLFRNNPDHEIFLAEMALNGDWKDGIFHPQN